MPTEDWELNLTDNDLNSGFDAGNMQYGLYEWVQETDLTDSTRDY